jgi:hypothetical protein
MVLVRDHDGCERGMQLVHARQAHERVTRFVTAVDDQRRGRRRILDLRHEPAVSRKTHEQDTVPELLRQSTAQVRVASREPEAPTTSLRMNVAPAVVDEERT